MNFFVGQSVKFLNEPGEGKIISALNNGNWLVQSSDGLEYEYAEKYLVPLSSQDDYKGLSQKAEDELIRNKLAAEDAIQKKIKKAKSNHESRELIIDLHIYELTDSSKNMSNHEMLLLQMKHFRAKMAESKAKKIHRLVIIHGVGEGVLRSEIRHALRNYDFIEFGDADYNLYGYGATEVIFKRWD